ncbi:DUF6188 family protein [Solibacillus sp. FSL W8-0474]|uniref:DUF6188 family protein n=1 Tax=Solibacillus sp. FSL W8-0474 TaxID=2975336 RepID=UPI0030FAEB91
MMEHIHIQHLMEKYFLHETIDSLHFWGPVIQFSTSNSCYDEVTLRIEGTFKLTQNGETNVVKREANDKLSYLTALARQKVSSVQLLLPNNLCLQFVSGMQLEVIGDNDQFEGWQLQAQVDDDIVLIVAGPGEQLTLFE